MNANASMVEPMAEGSPVRRIDVFQANASQGIELFRGADLGREYLRHAGDVAGRVPGNEGGLQPGFSDTLILWTDGGRAPPDGLTLDEALRELERLALLT